MCVVDVTKSQSLTDSGAGRRRRDRRSAPCRRGAAPRPRPRSSRNSPVSTVRGYAQPPQTISFGRHSFASAQHLVVVDHVRLARDAVVRDRVEPPAEVDLEAVREVAAVIELERRGSCRPARAQPCRRPCSSARPRAAGRSRARRRTAPSRGRSRAARSRRRPRTRRSSACPDTPRRTCSSAPSRRPRARDGQVKFSDAISSICPRCRSSSLPSSSAISGIDLREPGAREVLERLLRDRHAASLVRQAARAVTRLGVFWR